jgi:hypothetical protein
MANANMANHLQAQKAEQAQQANLESRSSPQICEEEQFSEEEEIRNNSRKRSATDMHQQPRKTLN